MVKTAEQEFVVSQQNETQKQRKKQAKQEAKIMLKVGKAKKEVGKAQKKLTRAQSNLDESQAHLHKLEEHLQQIRTPEEPQAQASQTQEVIDEVYQEPLLVSESTPPQADTEVPVEGSTDSTTDAAPISTSFEEQPLTQAESDEHDTPSPEAIAETDTTSPENTANGNSTLSPDEVQTLVEHGEA